MSGIVVPLVKLLFCAIRDKFRIKLRQGIVQITGQAIRCAKSVIAMEPSRHGCKVIVQGTVIDGFQCVAGKGKHLEGRVIAKYRRY